MEHNLKNSNHIFRVDRFKVPAAARDQFLERARASHDLLRTIPGFVEDFFLERSDDSGVSNIVTIVVWQDAQAFHSAKATVEQQYQKRGYNPGEVLNRLGIEADMAAYTQLNT
jgi:heme-degrading monooxygenase HmoA